MTQEIIHIERGIHICPVCGEGFEYMGVCSGTDAPHPPEITEEFTEPPLTGEVVLADTVSFTLEPESNGVSIGFRDDGKPMVIPS